MVGIPEAQDLSMDHKQVEKFLDALSHQMFTAGLDGCDAICYGSLHEAAEAGKVDRCLRALLGAVPKKIIDGYNFNQKLVTALKELEKAHEAREKISG